MASFRKGLYKFFTRDEGDVILETCNEGEMVNMMMPQRQEGQEKHEFIKAHFKFLNCVVSRPMMNIIKIEDVKKCIEDVIKWNELEEKVFKQKSKLEWLRLGDGSTSMDVTITFLQARREIRQGDPIFPLIFVVIMEYLNIILHKMQRNHDFNHHVKCEKLRITNLSSADDFLLFLRGDYKSIELIMSAFNNLSMSFGLKANLEKCRIYFGGVDDSIKKNTISLTTFRESPLPFRCLGVPLTCKKLSIHHYMTLVDEIV
ncbi:uncharacterized protein LOC131605787 [Vicia villosa]|uniref:uncharacterized protein LOC131605787 n=1 Tax=Vicia villosa TaxID=3911 RepID=UPI00273B5947|nr:uncharacterized protein LOC131605787 [Vicia villosa]